MEFEAGTKQFMVAIVIPAYNEGERLNYMLSGLCAELDRANCKYDFELVIVDDASIPSVQLEGLKSIPFKIHLLRHPVNLGQGASLETGFAYCRREIDPDFVLTMDADGQHDPADIIRFLAKIIDDNLDIVFGNRFKRSPSIPPLRKAILKLAGTFEKIITGIKLADSHNGFRVFNRLALRLIVLTQNRMAHATEIKQVVARNKLRFGELDTAISYTEDSLRKGQSNIGALVILRDLIKTFLFERLL